MLKYEARVSSLRLNSGVFAGTPELALKRLEVFKINKREEA